MDIFKDGLLIEIKVRFWTGAKILTADDLGLKKDTISKLYKLGKKMLVPKQSISKFRSIESRARFLIESNSFKYPFGNARFIPKKKFFEILGTLEKHKKDYKDLIDQLIIDYDKLREKMLPTYREAAETAYERQKVTEAHLVNTEKEREYNKKDFVNHFLERINTFYPSTESLRNKFSIEWNIYEIALPKTRQVESDKNDAIYKAYQEEVKNKIGTFLEEVIISLRTETVKLCKHIINNMKTNTETDKAIHGRAIRSLLDFIDNFLEFNFVGDTEIEQQLIKLKDNFLKKHKVSEITRDEILYTELKRRLNSIVQKASDISTINTVTEQYRKKIQWSD